ncbi:hypothetical protein [Pinibacter aurantiacus]|uniref:Uncharacterized protein n=1 Tax=Pinibacter aurantiacus TaxID=2851599 RepID=A0A9E2S7M3_9BACT|nr:hypothetical protein [Pinibacter aurantiacus]MBV4358103.1 hypothetical protein [Pinibacter aurantiacus]
MLEIILIIYYSKKIGALALDKGESKGKWVTIMIISWFLAEILGAVVGLMLLGQQNIYLALLVGYGFAFGSYYLIRNALSKKPDIAGYDQMIDEIGSGDQEQ